MKMVDAYILKLTCIASSAKCLNKYLWRTCHAAEMDMVT
jgi:hypothetical protein